MKPLLILISFILLHGWLWGKVNHKVDGFVTKARLNGLWMSSAVGSLQKELLHSSVRLFRNEKLIAHGVIVDSGGLILTKASSSVGAKIMRTYRDEPFPIRVRKRDEVRDLALWQIISSTSSWPAVTWHDDQNTTAQGDWVISVGESPNGLTWGVVSAKVRSIGREGGVMGVILEETNSSDDGIKVIEVLPHAAGDRAGLKIMDRILRVDGKAVRTTNQIKHLLQHKDPGDLLNLLVSRKKEQASIRLTLGHRSVAFDLFNRNLLMSGPVSKRKDNFPLIIQHDLFLNKEMMGGGLFDLSGTCLGINIARVDRVTNYALPSSVILPTLNSWLGQFR